MLIKWKKDYELGIDKIDSQHKQLVYIINQLNFAKKNNSHANVLKNSLQDLSEYANDHFEFEEGIILKCGYPEIENHRKRHLDFINKIQGFYNEMSDGDLMALDHILAYLNEWLISHILTEDIKYSRLVHAIARGVTRSKQQT